jgi:hypothetical protein
MIYLLALLPATALTLGGYLVLVLSTRAEGRLRSFGRYLGFWAFTLAGLVILGALFAAAQGPRYCPHFAGHGMHGPIHGPLPEGHPPVPFHDEPRGEAAEPTPGSAPSPPGH